VYIRQPIVTFLSRFVSPHKHKEISVKLHRNEVERLRTQPQTAEVQARIRWYEQRLKAWR